MRAKVKLIEVRKLMGDGYTNSVLPSYLTVGQRHFEKEKPSGGVGNEGGLGFILPVDMLSLTVPTSLLDGVESIEMVYRKKTVTP